MVSFQFYNYFLDFLLRVQMIFFNSIMNVSQISHYQLNSSLHKLYSLQTLLFLAIDQNSPTLQRHHV